MNWIQSKFAERVLVPREGISGHGPGKYETQDGKVCDAIFISIWDNADGRYDDQLDFVCRKYWDMPFSRFRSLWIARVGELKGFWYLVQLKETNARAA